MSEFGVFKQNGVFQLIENPAAEASGGRQASVNSSEEDSGPFAFRRGLSLSYAMLSRILRGLGWERGRCFLGRRLGERRGRGRVIGLRGGRSELRVSAVVTSSVDGSVKRSLKARSETMQVVKSSSAMEQLDIERGVCVPFRKYTPETVKNKVLESKGAVLSLLGRGVEIVWNLGFYWASLAYDYAVGRDEEVVPYRARQLRNLLCDLGPSFVKAGQVLANRPDIIRADYMNELCILQDDVPSFPNEIAFRIIEEELGRPLESVFSQITSTTIAAASLGQVYKATLRETGEDVAIKVQRPEIEPIIYRDLFLFRTLASFLNGISLQKLGCNAELIVDEFGKARNIEDFLENFKDDPTVKIPKVYKNLSGSRVLVMEWIDGIRCTNPQAIKDEGIDINGFLTVGNLAYFMEIHILGNIFAMRDGRIAYVDFGNVAVAQSRSTYIQILENQFNEDFYRMLTCELKYYSFLQQNKQNLIDAVVHAVNEDYTEMANDFTRLGFLAKGTDVFSNSSSIGSNLAEFCRKRIEGICFTLKPDFKFLEVAYPYVAKRLLTDPNPALRERLIQSQTLCRQTQSKLDLTDTIKDGARLFLVDEGIRRQLLLALTEDSKLHIQELVDVYRLLEADVDVPSVALEVVRDLPNVARDFVLSWSQSVLSDR
ncbi:unnamed protein product [Rhodiola kirilowii]